MIKPALAFLQMEQELILAKAVEFQHTALSERPEALDTIYVPGFICKLIYMMINAKMFLKAEIDQAVVSDPSVGVNDGIETYLTPYNSLQSASLAVRNDFRINPVTSLVNAKDDRLAAGSASTLSGDSPAAEIRFVELDNSGLKGCVAFAFSKQPNSYLLKNYIHAFSCYTGQLASLCRSQIHRKVTYYLTKFLLCDSGTAIIPVNLLHLSSLTPIKRCLTTLDP